MKQIQAVEKISQSFIESWNDSNPTERLNPELIKLVEYYFHLVFVAGLDGLAGYLLKDLESGFESKKAKSIKGYNVGIRHMMNLIKEYNP